MKMQSRYLGVDVSKELLVVAFEGHRWEFSNSKQGFGKLIAQIRQQSSEDLANWADVAPAQTAAGSELTITDPGPTGQQRFYRLKLSR